MFVAGRACRGSAARLLVRALAAALLTNVLTQLASEELDRTPALAECLRRGQASVVANNSWQYISVVDAERSSSVFCYLNVSITEQHSFAVRMNSSFSSSAQQLRLLLRIDQLQFEQRTPDAPECANTSYVHLRRLAARSRSMCSATADRYAWLEDWLTVVILLLSGRSVSRFDASFALLPALNACQAARRRAANLAVDNVAYVYAPDAWYADLLPLDSLCQADRNYTVHVRAANVSRLVRVTLLATPSAVAVGCRRLCIERRCFVAGEANASVEAAEHITVVYAAIGPCPGVERTGFTLKLESVLSPAHTSQTGGGLSEANVIALVAALIAAVFVVLIILVVFITIRKRWRRNGQRGNSHSVPPSGSMVNSRRIQYTSVPVSYPDGNGLAAASIVFAEREISMVDNELYSASRVG